jgi:zinc transporter ZupT
MHLRMPSIDHGVKSFAWGLALGLFVWIGLLSVSFSQPVAFILGAVAGCAIYLFVRRNGVDEPTPPA